MGKIITEDLIAKYAPDMVDVLTFHTKVVGTTFRNPEHLKEVENGDFVLLDPEVGNPADPHAVKVLHDRTGNHIGYVRKETDNGDALASEVWHNTNFKGHLYVARVQITGAGKENVGFNLEVKHLIPKVAANV
jgi:hypothetical protein